MKTPDGLTWWWGFLGKQIVAELAEPNLGGAWLDAEEREVVRQAGRWLADLLSHGRSEAGRRAPCHDVPHTEASDTGTLDRCARTLEMPLATPDEARAAGLPIATRLDRPHHD